MQAQNQSSLKKYLTKAQIEILVRQHFAIINERDPVKRIEMMQKSYSKNFHINDTHFEHINYRDFNGTIQQIHKKFPDNYFIPTSALQTLPNAAKISWKLGNDIIGEDIFIFKNGKIKTILAFAEPAPG
ncbi:MAG: hypothetical protein HY305_04835 [Sphingobacteriales bacterium]|nr:hypothetical protein [Sphingobacteriales bacterium]